MNTHFVIMFHVLTMMMMLNESKKNSLLLVYYGFNFGSF
jgi:hypothetical protein